MFDSSREQNAPFRFKLGVGMVIKGWDIALATMKVGEKAEIICSPQYAYGENGRYVLLTMLIAASRVLTKS